MGGSDKRKQSLYFPEEMLREIQEEATRQDRSLSWIVQKAWKISRKEIMKYPSVNEFPGEEDERGAPEYVAVGPPPTFPAGPRRGGAPRRRGSPRGGHGPGAGARRGRGQRHR